MSTPKPSTAPPRRRTPARARATPVRERAPASARSGKHPAQRPLAPPPEPWEFYYYY